MSDSPSMKSIAALAGVSVMTVSRALRKHPEVKAATRERIQKIATELGYRKNPFISALMEHRRSGKPIDIPPVIAHVHCFPHGTVVRRNLINIREGILRQAQQQGFTVDEFFLNEPGMTPHRLVDILRSRNIRGAIFEHFFDHDVTLDIDLSGIAAVALAHTLKRPALNRVVIGEYLSVEIAVAELRSRGYRRIGLAIYGRQDEDARIRRESAWLLYQTSLPDDEKIPLLKSGRYNLEEYFPSWYESHRPEVILSTYGRVPKLLEGIKEGLSKKVGYVRLGWNDEDRAHGIAGIDPDWRQVGVSAANNVIEQIYRGEFGVPEKPIVTMIEGRWVDGKTVRPALPHCQ
ncbi:LacI family DNA-binding transcriptional regulator [Pelagicoccus sp. NFK12]|uniref:LacI family DNA-binding transcriptional regulator n=1 Tax=Pelagicoccus enzymogenes TaxID=2773457 RepID=A0A927IIM4_9BACT|nr:LacI family DNA-binding transcriptional regulator [Pelagicoccus enzymogenes]MBD5780913.1 LacI family DNA-binding transcriptional regulator [Pelagicoccus enzymogenes]